MFSKECKNLMFDLSAHRDIYDEEQGRKISKQEASEVIRKACFEELGLTKDSTPKQIKRALKSEKGVQFFSVIEEILETQIEYGIRENEFFNQFVESRNMADGDRNEFWVNEDVILTVSKVAGDAHNLSMQRLGSGQSYSVNTNVFGIRVGGDIRLFLTGRKDWSEFTDAVVKAYMVKIQNIISYQFTNGTNLIPVPSTLTGTGALSSSTKGAFDTIIEKVGAANLSSVVIMGTKTALRNLTALTTIDWASPAASIKESVANTGIIGTYEGIQLMEIPQRYEDKTLTNALVANDKLYIMPNVDNKFIKFVDYGETELEVSEKGDTQDDMQSYEVQRRFGVSTLMTRYFGIWTLA